MSKPTPPKKKKSKKNQAPPCMGEFVSMATQQYLDDMGHTPPDNLHKVILCEAERALITTVLSHTDHNQSRAADILGITRATLRNRMARYKL
ncbi:MAG TPA: helix-turn-helix domain-containing protein [Wenzhouxiangella sp.]